MLLKKRWKLNQKDSQPQEIHFSKLYLTHTKMEGVKMMMIDDSGADNDDQPQHSAGTLFYQLPKETQLTLTVFKLGAQRAERNASKHLLPQANNFASLSA